MMSSATALILKRDKDFSYKFYVGEFPGGSITEGKKLIMISDPSHVEIIYTNEVLSISCFFDLDDFSSVTSLSGIAHQRFGDKQYDVHRLGFYANHYHCKLPELNRAIREFDYLLFEDGIIRVEPGDKLIDALQKIYLMLEDILDKSVESIKIFKPINFHLLETLVIEEYERSDDVAEEMGFSII